MLNKQKVYSHFANLLSQKMNELQNVLVELKETGSNETKSTAGDKHETALAMLQIEQANKRNQLEQLMLQKNVLDKINPSVHTVKVVVGSLIKTNNGFYFLSVALGKCMIDGEPVVALSAQSPLGKILMGLKKGDTTSFNQTHFSIEELS